MSTQGPIDRVLVVEDDPSLAHVLRGSLEFEGFAVEGASHAAEALRKIDNRRPDLVLLDLGLPDADGLEICAMLNDAPQRIPVIVLTSRDRPADRVIGLKSGADDYVTKPFQFDELLARIRAVLRRRVQAPLSQIALGEVVVDFQRRVASRRGVPIDLTYREVEVLRHLAEHAGQVVTRDDLLRDVWGRTAATLNRTVDNLILQLRRKIEADPHQPVYLRTVHRDGYSLSLGG